MGVKVTGQFEPAGAFSIVDGKDVSGHITGSNISGSATGTGSFGKVYVDGNILGNSDNTTEIGSTPDNGAIKKLYMVQGGEISFGDTTTSNFFGISEGTNNSFGDSDTMGIYYRNGLNVYSANNAQRLKLHHNGRLGLNTTTDAGFLLDINGTSRLTGDVTLGGDISGSLTSTGSFGKLLGDGSSLTGIAGYTVANSANNRILTSVDSTNANAEANLTFDGTNLGLAGGAFNVTPNNADSHVARYKPGSNGYSVIRWNDGSNNSLWNFGLASGNNIYYYSYGSSTVPLELHRDTGRVGIGLAFGADPVSMLQVGGTITSTGITANGNISGSATSTGSFGHIKMPDQGMLSIGNSNDLQIYHGGSNSIIQDAGTGGLILRATELKLIGNNTSEEFLVATENAGVDIYYNDVKKFETTNTGVTVSGNLIATGDITAQRLIVSSSVTNMTIAEKSGSTIFGDSTDDTHQFTGSVNITGSVTLGPSGSFIGDGSQLTGLTPASITTYNSATNNRIITSVNSTTVQGEANLTFDGTNLEVLSGNLKVGTPGPSNGIDGIITLYNNTGTATFVLHNQDGNGRFGVSSDNNRTLTFDNQGSGNMSINVQGNVTASGNISGSLTSIGSFGSISTATHVTASGTVKAGKGEIITTGTGDVSMQRFLTNGSDWYVGAGGSGQGYFPNKFYIYSETNGGSALVVDNSLNIGIGDRTPSYKLDVNGTIRAVGVLYANNGFEVGNGHIELKTANGKISGSATSTGSFGKLLGDASDLSNLPASYTVANSSNNRILTSVDSLNGNAEANLTFDGSTLVVTGAITLGGKLTAGSNEIESSNFDINGGTIDSTPIGLSGTSTANFSNITGSALRIGGSTSKFSLTDTTPNGTANAVFGDAMFGSTSTTNTGITMFGTGQVGIAFGDAAFDRSGQFRYQHGTNKFEIITDNVERATIDSVGISVTGKGIFSGDVEANGNIVGDGSTTISGINTITTGGNISGSATSIVSAGDYRSLNNTIFVDGSAKTFGIGKAAYGGANTPGAWFSDLAGSGGYAQLAVNGSNAVLYLSQVGSGDLIVGKDNSTTTFTLGKDGSIVSSAGATIGGTVQGTTIRTSNGGGPQLVNSTPNGTTPSIHPTLGDTNTGIGYGGANGSTADNINLITGGTTGLYIDSSQNVVVPSGNISGSLTSTGSFGSLVVADKVQGSLRVTSGASGVGTTDRTDGDDLVVENSDHGGISILTPDNKFSTINFGSPSDNRGAVLDYSHSTKVLNIGTDIASGKVVFKSAAGAINMTLDASGNLGIGKTPVEKLDISGNIMANHITTNANGTGSFAMVRVTTGNISGSLTSTGSFGRIETVGNLEPKAHNTSNLGSESRRWANIYSADLQLSNMDNDIGNEIDGTKGSWTIQEGDDDLYLLNRKNGKKYKFKLEEIT